MQQSTASNISSSQRSILQFKEVNGYTYNRKENPDEIRVSDSVFDLLYFEQLIWDLIDTPHMQRLRKVKQLACLEYVYPCATHTRFDHSIGTAHLAKTFLEILIKNNPKAYQDVSSEDRKSAILTVTIAGLLHEMGQGPFSRAFDHSVATGLKVKDASISLFRNIMKLKSFSGRLTTYQIKRIEDLMKGVKKQDKRWATLKRPWEFEIISNELSSIDVDKFDYFRRDATYLGAKNVYIDHDLLFEEARIIDNEICYPTNVVENIYNIFHSRYKLYKTYYFDVVNKAIETMIIDILNQIKDIFKLREACQDLENRPDNFLMLTDNIIDVAEDLYFEVNQARQDSKQHPYKQNWENLKNAKQLMERIRTRDIYKFVREIRFQVKEEKEEEDLYKCMGQEMHNLYLGKAKDKQQKLEKYLGKSIASACKIDEESIFVMISDVGLGLRDANPLTKVGFFRKENEQNFKNCKKLDADEVKKLSMLYTNAFIEKSIKFFVKKIGFFNQVNYQVIELERQLLLKSSSFLSGQGGRTPSALPSEQPYKEADNPFSES